MSVWTISFLLVTLVEGMIIVAFESYVFAQYAASLPTGSLSSPEGRTIPTYLALFIFAFFFDMAMSWDAVRLQNTIQVIGLNLFQGAMLIYSAIQVQQIQDAIVATELVSTLNYDPWPRVKPFLIAVPSVIALAGIILLIITWKLYDEFGWTIYKHIGASVQMRRHFLVYQIFVALLKFDFFFFIGFEIQSLVIIISLQDTEFWITIAALPVTILILIFCAWSVRHEMLFGMLVAIAMFVGGLAYFLFKLIRMYQPSQAYKYIHARRPLTTFAVITLVLLLFTIVNAIMCVRNFKKGLKDIIVQDNRARPNSSAGQSTQLSKLSKRKQPEDEVMDENNYLHPKKPPARMTIE